MGRRSTRKNKNIYQIKREELGYSREKASLEMNDYITPERIDKIETGNYPIRPDEVLCMAKVYKSPELCNHYCSQECSIGKTYVPEIRQKDLSQIILEMLATLNSMQNKRVRLIEITYDGKIQDDEIEDFVEIQKELERISTICDTLRLWVEQTIMNCEMNEELYQFYMNNQK